MKTISRADVQSKIDGPEPTTLVDALPAQSFQDYHLPGAINIPFDDERFDEKLARAVPDKSEHIVVYCMDESCDASPKAAKRMETLGYRNVFDYEAGKQDWKKAGLPVEP